MKGQHSVQAVEFEGHVAEVVVVDAAAAAELVPDFDTFVAFEIAAQMFTS